MNKKPETRVILLKTTVNPPNAVEIATQQRVEIAKALSDVRRRNRIAAAGLVVSGLIILGGIGSFYFLRSDDQDPLSLKLQFPFAIVHNNKKDAQQPQNGPGGFEAGRQGNGSEQNGTGHGSAGDAPVVSLIPLSDEVVWQICQTRLAGDSGEFEFAAPCFFKHFA